MALIHNTIPSNKLRTPEVPRGEALIVDRYHKEDKVALVNPEDLAMLEESHELLERLGRIESLEVDGLTLKTLAQEDQPDPDGPLEDPERIAALLGL